VAFSEVLDKFVTETPWCVMARGLLESAFAPDKLNSLFEENACSQNTRKLLFSTTVDIMAAVVCRIRRSVNAAAVQLKNHDLLPVSVDAVYDKLDRVETQTSAALVRHTAVEAAAVLEQLHAPPLVLLKGYDVRIVDGNHPEGTEHRLGILRDVGGGALPGVVLAVFNPQTQLLEEVVLSEYAYTQESRLLEPLLERLRARQLWLADRHYCASSILFKIASKGAFFLFRQHLGRLRWRLVGERRYCGRSETGKVYEQEMILINPDTEEELQVRRITVELDKATRDGDQELHVLSNVPAADASAAELAELYRQRWQLETVFATLTVYLRCEPKTLGYPKAALFAFCVAIACYNLLGAMLGAVRAVHGEAEEEKVSMYAVADELAMTYRGMDIAVPDGDWEVFRTADAATLAALLKEIAARMTVSHYHKYPSQPKKSRKTTRKLNAATHFSTHRLLHPELYPAKGDP
jgi:hypothetical protein